MQSNKSNSQAFSLNWNKFPLSHVSAFNDFKNNLDFVDVTLACEGQLLSAHKLLLASCSAFFRDLLKSNPCKHPVVILPSEVRFVDLEKMLQFIYEGKVNILEENLVNFLKTAELFKITGFEDRQATSKLREVPAIVSDHNEVVNINILNAICPRLRKDSQSKALTGHSTDSISKGEKLTCLDNSETILKQQLSTVSEADFKQNYPVTTYTSSDSIEFSSRNNFNPQTQMHSPEVTPSCSVLPFIKEENDYSLPETDCCQNMNINISSSVVKDECSGHIANACNSFFSKDETNNDLNDSSDSFYENSTDYEGNPSQEEEIRKRKCNLQLKKNTAKLARNSGLEYISSSKSRKVVKARQMGNPCKDNCKLKCTSRIITESRKLIFEKYWALGDTQKQREFLSSSMMPIRPKYQYPRNENKRRDNNAFHFEINGELFRVCKMFFKSTLGITDRPIRTVITKRNEVGIVSGDLRGKHGKR